MTDLAQPIANTAPKHPVLLAPLASVTSPGLSLLPLSGPGPFRVLVKLGDNVAEFALPENPNHTFTDGVQWTPPIGGSAPANITFEFVSPSITQLTSNLTFAPTSISISGLGLQQTGTVQASSGTCAFSLHTLTGRIDPQIVVTPQ